jgi:ADP-heptose:LPS heptosyltransferase
LGDILVHRMMFEDIKKSGLEIHFACPKQYHAAVQDHPYLDKVLDSETVSPYEYLASYNTTTACGRYESRIAPLSGLHRSDIWSKHCGFDLTNHEMHINLSQEEVMFGKNLLCGLNTRMKPTVAVCPVSAQGSKNLVGVQVSGVIDGLRDMGFMPFGLHTKPVPEIDAKKSPMVHGLDIRQWMGVMNAADYVVAVDTSAFHLAGGLKKPLVGIFSFADGDVYSKYYPSVELIQKHRNRDPEWTCGPCYAWVTCPKSKLLRKPCITEITAQQIMDGFSRLLEKYPKKY